MSNAIHLRKERSEQSAFVRVSEILTPSARERVKSVDESSYRQWDKSLMGIAMLGLLTSCASYEVTTPTGTTIKARTFCKTVSFGDIEGRETNGTYFSVQGYKGQDNSAAIAEGVAKGVVKGMKP